MLNSYYNLRPPDPTESGPHSCRIEISIPTRPEIYPISYVPGTCEPRLGRGGIYCNRTLPGYWAYHLYRSSIG
jgi:hypothetical protein